MSKLITDVAAKRMALHNTFQPQMAGRLLTKTYQPVGTAQVPKVIPPLISGVTAPSVPAPQNSGSAQGHKK